MSIIRNYRRAALKGLLFGWLAGVLWWAGLVLAYGSSTVVTLENGIAVERQIGVFSRLVYAPCVAIPWGGIGLLVSCVACRIDSSRLSVLASLGMVAGGLVALGTHSFNGWLTLIMPVYCLLGTIAGVLIGLIHAGLYSKK